MPKLLQNMQSQVLSIPYADCLAQIYFHLLFGVREIFLLVTMAYDHHVAIWLPLHYTTIMSSKLCLILLVLSGVLTTACTMLYTLLMARLFGADFVIPHIFCDTPALLKLTCSDTWVIGLVIFFMGGLILIIPFLLIIRSCAQIIFSALIVPSVGDILKAFSTCGSHLSVVSLFYGTIIGLYSSPSTNNSTVKETDCHGCDVLCGDAHAAHLHLQPKEQRHAGGPGKSLEKENIFLSKVVTIGLFILFGLVGIVMLIKEFYT